MQENIILNNRYYVLATFSYLSKLYSAVQRLKAVSVLLTSNQILHFGFVSGINIARWHVSLLLVYAEPIGFIVWADVNKI